MKQQIKIRTRYQRMTLAVRAAEILRQHGDPEVQELGQCITYALGAPLSTLNNILECFPKSLRAALKEVSESPNPAEHALLKLRTSRRRAS